MEKYYCYGSGMFGCLYDYGPNFCKDKEDAINSFSQVFEDTIESDELVEMRNNLKEDGIHRFRNPSEAGAHYCDITEHSGKMPEDSDD